MRTQHGFTLVELSIVLLVIGLLLGGVLKGQALIDSARVKNLAQDLRTVPALAHAYQDTYRALPGDDPGAVLHLCGSTPACTRAGNGNGSVDGDWDASTDLESVRFWQHLRLAGITSGSTDLSSPGYLPRNALGGRLGVQRGGILGLPGTLAVCSGAIPGSMARALDIALDDGEPSTGSLRTGTQGTSGIIPVSSANPLVDASLYTVCASL